MASPAAAPGRELLLQATVRSLPSAPAVVRLSRVTLAPGGAFEPAPSPGPTFAVVESGTATTQTAGPAVLLRSGAEGNQEPLDILPAEPAVLAAGDRLAVPAETAFSLRAEDRPAAVLIAEVAPPSPGGDAVPVGNPATGETSRNGVTVQVLGEATTRDLPEGAAAVTLERFTLTAGFGLPGYAGPVLVAVEKGGFASTLEAGDVQVSQGGQAGSRPPVEVGGSVAVRAGDALFFGDGMGPTPPLAGTGTLVLLRLGLLPIGAETASAEGIAAGARVVVTQPGVRLRATPSTEGEVIAGLAAGQALVVTGSPVAGSGLLWYPVTDPNDPATTGFIAGDFLEPAN